MVCQRCGIPVSVSMCHGDAAVSWRACTEVYQCHVVHVSRFVSVMVYQICGVPVSRCPWRACAAVYRYLAVLMFLCHGVPGHGVPVPWCSGVTVYCYHSVIVSWCISFMVYRTRGVPMYRCQGVYGYSVKTAQNISGLFISQISSIYLRIFVFKNSL